MKKILVFLCVMASALSAMAQVVTLQFTGTDRTMQDYVRLHHVSVYDEDQLWHQVIYYPDTTLSLYDKGAMGIEENGYDMPLKLYQNTPNPFSGSTDVMLATAEEGAVTLEVADMQGRSVVSLSVQSLLPGSHQFCITLATSGTYIMSARQNGMFSSIKMACNAGGGSNAIAHVGSTDSDGTITVFLKNMTINGSYPFKNGDRMSYKGFAMIDDTERISEPIICVHQWTENTSYKMKFDVARPTVITLATSDIAPYIVTLNGNVTADNNALVTERGFCWLHGSATPTIADNIVRVGEGVGTYSGTIADGLAPGETYRVRAYAINAIGISYGNVMTFTTSVDYPTVVTNDATELTVSSATLNGEISFDGGAPVTVRGFQYGTEADHFASAISLGAGTGTISTNISNLADNTTYFYRAYATNSAGIAYGETKSFTTIEILLPSVTTLQATDVTRTSLTLNASITSDGGSAVTARGFYWGTAEGNLPNYVESEHAESDFSATISDLTPNTIYYYRAAASNVKGTALGDVLSVQTNPPVEPIVVTNGVTNMTVSSAVLNGTIADNGGVEVTARGFYWGTDADNLENNAVSIGATNNFSANLTGLTYNTTYYYKAYATNSVGTGYGEVLSFTTPSIPTVITGIVSGMTATGATLSGNVIDNGGVAVTDRGFLYGTSESSLMQTIQSGSGTGNFTGAITGLAHSTTYYYKAYATNSVGTAYGEVLSFATPTLPTVTTGIANGITATGATLSGNVIDNGGATVTDRGFMYGTSASELTQTVQCGSGTSSFAMTLTGLSASTTYYYKAYATNLVGTSYGDVMQFTTSLPVVPTVQTLSATEITYTDAILNGNITSDGGATVTDRGFKYGTSESELTQTIQNCSGTGNFTAAITGLTHSTTYYYKAYATNSAGTAYGEVMSFTTECNCGGTVKVTDIDGNQYATVLIGEQCWMAENLKTTKFADGTSIPLGSSTNSTTAYRYCPNNSSSNVSTYGYLYNWPAAMHGASSSNTNPSNVQGVCPAGWHLPSDAEWTQLTDYVGSQSEYQCNGSTTNIAKSLASTTGWSSSTGTCAVGNTPTSNNSTGFGALPAGYYDDSAVDFLLYADFWSATESSSSDAYASALGYNEAFVFRYYAGKYGGRSVRCVRDNSSSMPPSVSSVTTSTATTITSTSATLSGNVISDGGVAVTERGFMYGTSESELTQTIQSGSGTGNFTGVITGLTASTTYYYKAYATNSAGTAYGEVMQFTTRCECGGSYKVTDIDGNQYATVQIGDQCWMAENLRVTKFADGTSIPLGSSTSSTTAYRYNPNNSSSNVSTYGYLYNWPAAMHGASSSEANPSGVQGVCPAGWHLPSDAEWTQLYDYVSSQSEYQCNGITTNIAKSLASTTGWSSSTGTCDVGNTPTSNNSTGFGALPAGIYSGSYNYFGSTTGFWSATEGDSSYAYNRYLYYNRAFVNRINSNKSHGRSVRCVKDE